MDRILLKTTITSSHTPRTLFPHPSLRGTGGGRRDLEAAEGDVIAGLFVQPRQRWWPTVIRPPRRGVGGLRGTLFFQTDRGAAGEHVDSGAEEAHEGFQAVRPLTLAWVTAPPRGCGAAGRGSGTPSSPNPKRADYGPCGTDGSPFPVRTPHPSFFALPIEEILIPPPPKVKRWLWTILGCPRCSLGSAADVWPKSSSLIPPAPAPCGASSPKSEPLQSFSLLVAPVSFAGWPYGLFWGAGLGRKLPPPPILSAVRVGSAARGPEVSNPSSETRLPLARPKGPWELA